MATTLTPSYPQYIWLFLAVRRADMQDKPHRQQITAPDYLTARRLIAREYIAAFAGRIPCCPPDETALCTGYGTDSTRKRYSPAYTFAP